MTLAIAPALARADVFEPITLASASAIPGFAGNQQADFAHDPAISGDGRYVVFDGSYGGATGVWRRDLRSGAVVAVASANEAEPAINAPDAELPSISDDGRYVSFTTRARLDPLFDTNPGPDVYVRDMEVPASQPCEPGTACAYTLVSAVDGSSAGLTYEPTGTEQQQLSFEEESFGSLAAGRSAISADGRKVAFVTTAISNLAGPGTPALQVAVRDLDTEQTELVSVRDDPASGQPLPGQPVLGQEGAEVYGAVYTGHGAPPPFDTPQPYAQPIPVGASISGDGTTVVWMGVDIAEQTRTLPAESLRDFYSEPLWRRIADGPEAPVRRITGGADPQNSACIASGETKLPATPSLSDPCQGPFSASQEGRTAGIWSGAVGDVVPRVSADGYSVAFLSNSPLASVGQAFGGEEPNSDLYLVNMHEPLTRMQALRQLSELASADQADLSENGPIEDLGISPNGMRIAFTTKRTQFPLGSPAYVSAPESVAGLLELFVVDLENDTLTRLSSFEGGASEHPHEARPPGEDPYSKPSDGALSPSFSDDGRLTAFASTASNLVFGDGNTPPLNSGRFDGSDAFAVATKVFSATPTPQTIGSPPAAPQLKLAWRIGVTARAQRDGSVLLYVSVPGAGAIKAGAQSALRVRTKRRGRLSTSIATRSVASTKKTSRASVVSLAKLTLKLAPRYRALANRRPGLASFVTITFSAAHRPTLKQSVHVFFLRTAKPKKGSRR